MKIVKVVFMVVLFCFFISFQSFAETLEDRLCSELSKMKGIKMSQIQFSLDDQKEIIGAVVNIRVNTAYEMSEIQRGAIVNYIVYSTPRLIPENVKLNVSEEPLVNLSAGSVPYKSLLIEDKIATTIVSTLPVEEVFVNLVEGHVNFLGEFDSMAKAAVLVKLPKGYEYDDREVFSIALFISDSVENLPLNNILIIDCDGNSLFEVVP